MEHIRAQQQGYVLLCCHRLAAILEQKARVIVNVQPLIIKECILPEATYPETPKMAVDKIFPLTQPAPAAHTFELALVLGGTVSAGCYTAGVLDFLVEALDAWAAAIAQDDIDHPGAPTVPRHKVLFRVVTGTSGGGVNAVLLSRALSYVYPPARLQSAPEQRAKNPFYQIWVNALDIDGLLATDDLTGATTITSLLSGKPLAAAAAAGISFDSGQTAARQYVANPLPVILTYTNVAGIPYKQLFSGQTGRAEYFVNHADFVRFAIDIRGALPTPQYSLSPDTFDVGNDANDMLAWSGMASYALGTAAFPVGLPAVQIARPAGHYAYRYILPNSGQGAYSPQWLRPEWSLFVAPDSDAGSKYAFVSLDGGCTDNAPIGLAHDVLSGIAPTRETDGSMVNRAILLIDPFTDVPNFAALPKADLLSILFPTINCLIQNNRFNSADLAAFSDGSDFSRFLITPSRKNAKGDALTGGDAIASSGLAAFLGFFSRQYREHDYMLGRRNCQAFLKSWFSLAPDNAVFNALKPTAVETPPGSGNFEVPIIPLYGSALVEQPAPEIPAKFDPSGLKNQIDDRADQLLRVAVHLDSLGWLERQAYKAGISFASGRMASKAVKLVQAATQESKLLNPQ